MIDAQSALASPTVIRREDYQPPDWLVPDIALDFDLDPATTRVTAVLDVVRSSAHNRPLRLDGDGQVPLKVLVDGTPHNDWRMDGDTLKIDLPGGEHQCGGTDRLKHGFPLGCLGSAT